MGGLLRYTNAIVGMGLVGIGIAMIASPELVVPEMYGKKKNGQRVKGEPSTAWVAIGCFEVFMGTVLCMSFYWGKDARFGLGLVYLLLMCALMYDLSENAPKAGLAPFGLNNFTYTALIFTSCWYVVALIMNRLEPGYLTADKKTKHAVEGEKSSLLGAARDKAKAAAALDEERVEIVTYGASEETEPVIAADAKAKEPELASREVVNVSEAAPGPAVDVAREAEAEVVHRRWERHPKEAGDGEEEESSDGGDIAIDYGVSTDEEDAANEKKGKKKKGKEKEGAAEATKAEARAEAEATEATEATKAGGKEGEKKEEPARAEEAPAAAAAAAAPAEPPKPSAKERALLLDPQEEVGRILASRADAYAVLNLDAATVTDEQVADQHEVLELCVAQCGDEDSREEALDVLRAAHDALRSAWQRGLYGMFGYRGAAPKPKDEPEEGEAVAPEEGAAEDPEAAAKKPDESAGEKPEDDAWDPWNPEGAAKDPEEGAAKDLEEGGDEYEGLSEEAKERKKKLAAALAKVEARKRRAKERGEDEEFTYDDKRSTHGTVARLVSPTMSPKASSQAIAEEATAAAKAEEEAAAAAKAEEEAAAAAAAKAEEEAAAAAAAKAKEEAAAAAAAKAEEEAAAAAAAKAEEEAAAAAKAEEEAAAASAALAATALAAAAARAEEEEAAAKAKAEEEAAAAAKAEEEAAAAKAKAKAEEDAAAAAAAQAEEEEVFASPSTSEPVDDSDDEDPIAAAAFGSPAVEQSQSPERSEEDKLLDAAISSIRNLLTARHGAAYTAEQYDAWARHIGLSTGGADYENPPLGHPLFGGVDIMLKPPVGTPGRVKSLAQVVQARIDAERARDGEAKKSELLEMLDDMLDGASIVTSPSRSEIGVTSPDNARGRRAAAARAAEEAAAAEAKKAEDDSGGGDTVAPPTWVTPTSKFAALVNAARTQQRVSPQPQPPPPPPQFAGYGPYSPLPNVPSYDQYASPYGAQPGYYPQPPPPQQQQFPGGYGGYPLYASGAQQRTPPQLQPLSPSVDAWLEDESSGEDAAGRRRSSGGDEREATRASSGKKKPPSSSGGTTMRRESPRAMEAATMRRESPRAMEVPPSSYFGYAPSPPAYSRGQPGVVPGAVGLPSPGGVDDPRRLVILRDQRKGGAVILRERDEVWLEHVVDDVFIMVRRFDPSGPPEGRKFKIKARDADVYSSQDWDTASDDSQSMSTRSQETDATARL